MSPNVFSADSQKNARLRGKYDDIASGVDKCVFCDLKDKYILTEKKGLALTVNLFPYIDGQLLIVPRRHIESYSDVTPEEATTSFLLSQMAMTILREELGVKGVWVIVRDGDIGEESGKTVRHLHWNVMPYVPGLNTWNYQHLNITPLDLATKLRPVFEKMLG